VGHLAEVHQVAEAAYFGGLGDAGPRRARYAAFAHELSVRGMSEVTAWNVITDPSPESAYIAARQLLSRVGPPAAVLCHSDPIGIGLIRAFREAGVPPRCCPVMSIDGIAASAMTTPPLSTISVAPEQMGRSCGHLLLRSVGYDIEHDVPPKPELIVRESCGCRNPPSSTAAWETPD
jgi:LacI family transcriptional regulator